MSASTKLSASVKALCYLAETHPVPQSSASISENVGVNASKLRHLLSLLAKNDIVESTKGTSGGFLLKKNPAKLHLQEIYCSIEDRKAFHLHITSIKNKKNKQYKIYDDYFLNLFSEVQVEIEEKFKKITLKKIMQQLEIKSELIK